MDSGLEYECKVYTRDGKPLECSQRDTIQRIYDLNRDTDKRIDTLTDDIDRVNNNINQLRHELDERKLINNYNTKEKEFLRSRVDSGLERSEEVDKSIKEAVETIDDRLIRLETLIPEMSKSVEDIAWKYDRMFWLILSFLILFIIKTFIWGY